MCHEKYDMKEKTEKILEEEVAQLPNLDFVREISLKFEDFQRKIEEAYRNIQNDMDLQFQGTKDVDEDSHEDVEKLYVELKAKLHGQWTHGPITEKANRRTDW